MFLKEPSHWVILVVVLVLVFGATRLPTIAKGLGQSMKIFKHEVKGLSNSEGDSGEGEGSAPSTPAQTRPPEQPAAPSTSQQDSEPPASDAGGHSTQGTSSTSS